MGEHVQPASSTLGSKQSNIGGGKPCLLKKPVSAFILFMSDLKHDLEFKKQLGTQQKDYIKEGSLKWNAIDSETKQVYKDKAQVLKEQY